MELIAPAVQKGRPIWSVFHASRFPCPRCHDVAIRDGVANVLDNWNDMYNKFLSDLAFVSASDHDHVGYTCLVPGLIFGSWRLLQSVHHCAVHRFSFPNLFFIVERPLG